MGEAALQLFDTKKASKEFRSQRKSARARGIDWLLTFDEWKEVWRASGHYCERGKGRNLFCMARHGDTGPYSSSNVYITTHLNNIRDYYAMHGDHHSRIVHANQIARSKRDARGWTFVKRKRTSPYQVMWSNKYIGCFSTQVEAEAAHRAARERAISA